MVLLGRTSVCCNLGHGPYATNISTSVPHDRTTIHGVNSWSQFTVSTQENKSRLTPWSCDNQLDQLETSHLAFTLDKSETYNLDGVETADMQQLAVKTLSMQRNAQQILLALQGFTVTWCESEQKMH